MTAWREAMTLSGRHVTLRPLARSDRDAIVAARADDARQRGLLDHRARVAQVRRNLGYLMTREDQR